jgi:hypothetical protein
MPSLEALEAGYLRAKRVYEKALAPFLGPASQPVGARNACTDAWEAMVRAKRALDEAKA